MIIMPNNSQCRRCTNWFGVKQLQDQETGELFFCRAFDKSIPEAILMNQHNHRKPYPGDSGIRFKKREND